MNNDWIKDKKLWIFDIISDLVADFIYYDRKDDKDFPEGEIERCIKDGVITIKEMVCHFENELIKLYLQ